MKNKTSLEVKAKIKIFLDIVLLLVGVISFASFILLIGFYLNELENLLIQTIVRVIIVVFIVEEILRIFTSEDFGKYIVQRWVELILVIALTLEFFFENVLKATLFRLIPFLSLEEITLAYLFLSQIIILMSFVFKIIRRSELLTRVGIHPGLIFSLSFLALISIGTLFLMLPKASAGNPLSFVDALFTSTSAVCVTGLIVLDTAKDFTLLGKIIILILIQIGGLGVMTLTTFFSSFLAGGMSLRMRVLMKDFLGPDNLASVGSLLVRIILYTFIIEFLGALFLYFSLEGYGNTIEFGSLFVAIFHSISAFCNAGFSIFSENLAYHNVSHNYPFLLIITFLIFLGGIGFTSLVEISRFRPFGRTAKIYKHQLSLTTKLALSSSGILILVGTVLIFFADFSSSSLGDSFFNKLFNSFFHSVSARTCGFNTIDIASLSTFSAFVIIVLMWIGASPGGTGGGIKTTTFAITFLSLINYIRGKEKVEVFEREISQGSIHRALMLVIFSIIVLSFSSSLLILLEPDHDPINLFFETASAMGTVGLSRGITPLLSTPSKYLLIFTMFVGRIGILTFFSSFFKSSPAPRYSYPKNNVIVG